jgi:beta-alanine--pyruvate transaminase
VHSLKGAKHVADIRNYGLAAGFTIAALPGEPAKRPYEIAMKCWKKGFYVRYGGDTIQLAPPFISDPGRDRPPGQRPGRRPARNRLNS